MPPLSLLIKPASGLCDFRCRYCFYSDVMARREKALYSMMSLDTLETIVRRAAAYADGSASFAFQGGEPTLAGLDFYEKLVELQHKYAFRCNVSNCIQTNGGSIDGEWARFLKKNDFLVGLSIDGTKQAHDQNRVDINGCGTYDRAIKAAEMLKSHGVQFNILCVVNSENVKHPEETYNSLKEYGFIQFIPCIDDTGKNTPTAHEYGEFLIRTFDFYRQDIENSSYVSVRTFDNYISMLKGRRPENCAMNGRCTCYILIESNGDTFPCDFYALDTWKLGNINDNTFFEMLNSKRAKEFVSSSVYVQPECRACRYYSLCRGGCRRDREPFDSMGRPTLNKFCESYKMFFDSGLAYMRRLASSVR